MGTWIVWPAATTTSPAPKLTDGGLVRNDTLSFGCSGVSEGRPRIRDMTSERFRFEKTSAIDTDYTNSHRFNPCQSVKSVSHLRPLRLGKNVKPHFSQSSFHLHQELNRPAKHLLAKYNLRLSSRLQNRALLQETGVAFPSRHRRFHAGQLQESDRQPASDFRRAMPESVLRKPYQ